MGTRRTENREGKILLSNARNVRIIKSIIYETYARTCMQLKQYAGT